MVKWRLYAGGWAGYKARTATFSKVRALLMACCLPLYILINVSFRRTYGASPCRIAPAGHFAILAVSACLCAALLHILPLLL
jgi:hypothetical protein